MRLHLFAAAALAGAIASPVFAQDAPTASPHQPSTSLSQPDASAATQNAGVPVRGGPDNATLGTASAPVGKQSPVSGKVADLPPSSWSGSSTDWSMHAQACTKAYPSYDAATDNYSADGKSTRCMLSMGSSRNTGKPSANPSADGN